MSGTMLWQSLNSAPIVRNRKLAKARLDELAADDAELAAMLAAKPASALVGGVASHSPYLWQLMSRDARRLRRLLESPPAEALQLCLKALREACDKADSAEAAMQALRLAKQEAALLIALADIGGVWDVVEVTHALSDFADAAVTAALRYLLRETADAGKIRLTDRSDPEKECGLVILALGKHGARELNYSSDVDLVVFFDPQTPALADPIDAQPIYVRIVKALVRLLQERTGDGYVLRVDLRLRPDPGSTSVAISLPAAFSYYEVVGQNWERAALIKARPIAGQKPLGEDFIRDLAPFIWRKYFDYAAIADVHAMKRQIHAVRGHAEIKVAGHDVKLGRGGIREIEFFVQTQQLIFGGRRPHLRGPRTLDMLKALSDDGWVTAGAVTDLTKAYRFLRTIEHRLQMIADEQTQRLPVDRTALADFAAFCGYKTIEAFSTAITQEFRIVESEYARLFEHAPGLDVEKGNLVFTGTSDDPDTLATLTAMGFRDAPRAAETVRGWHFGRRPAVQSPRAREVLTELVPLLLESFSGSGDPDAALAGFDAALGRMPAAVELFSILKSNAAVRDLFGDILGGAPRLAQIVAQRPHVLDAAIDPSVEGMGDEQSAHRIQAMLDTAGSFEDFLDMARNLRNEEMFVIGTRMLSGVHDPRDAERSYTALAQALLSATFERVRGEFEIDHGRVAGARACILGLGKLGSRELTASSDLDLMLLYDFDEANPESDGARRIHATQYYTRLTQRLISALTAPTRAGTLYEVDLRLRPSGRKGPVATQFRSFVEYQRSEAETWEHMALTRARCVAGDAPLRAAVEDEIAQVLARPRDAAALGKYIRDMRALIAKEKGDKDPWDLKLARGGLLDLEFLAQFFVLGFAHDRAGIVDVSTEGMLEKSRQAGLLDDNKARTLIDAHRLMTSVIQLLRLSVEGAFDPGQAADGVKRRIALLAGLPDFRTLEADLASRREEVRKLFDSILAGGAARPA